MPLGDPPPPPLLLLADPNQATALNKLEQMGEACPRRARWVDTKLLLLIAQRWTY